MHIAGELHTDGAHLDVLVIVGGWAHYLHTLLPEASPLQFAPLTVSG